jgi:nitroimidazol reductase NimA-like FMN-containing flavoprotein (pyridoxamine 5'-phosphate oxidase superfamily)
MEVDKNGLEVLGRDECLRLLATAPIGRVGLSSAALPTVLPVTFRLVGDRILFRTGHGSKLDAATRQAVVAFEVDDFDLDGHSGWSVVAVGVAQHVAADGIDELDLVHIARWIPSPADRLVAISTEIVSGRRLVPGIQPPSWRPVPSGEEVPT